MLAKKAKSITTVFRHQLLLGPTLARQAKNRKQKEKERHDKQPQQSLGNKNDDNERNRERAQIFQKSGKVPRTVDTVHAIHNQTDRSTVSSKLVLRPSTKLQPVASNNSLSPTNDKAAPVVSTTTIVKAPLRKMSALTPDSLPSSLRVPKTANASKKAPKRRTPPTSPSTTSQPPISQEQLKLQTKNKRGNTKTHKNSGCDHEDSHKRPKLASRNEDKSHGEIPASSDVSSAPLQHRSSLSSPALSRKRPLAPPSRPQGIVEKVSTHPHDAKASISAELNLSRNPITLRDEVARHWEMVADAPPGEVLEMVALHRQHQRRRQYALEATMAATDVPTIFASLSILKESYKSTTEWHPSVAQIVLQTRAKGLNLLNRALVRAFGESIFAGGLGYSQVKARVLGTIAADLLAEQLLGNMSVMPEQLVASGVSIGETIEILPTLKLIARETRLKFFVLAEEIMSL